MERQSITTIRVEEHTPRSHSVVDVRVVLARGGGWDVIATLGGQTVAIQHCEDWHRAERAYLRMSGDAQRHRDEAA